MYAAYVTPEEYYDMGYNVLPQDKALMYLIRASRQVDTLTFNRIEDFEKLTQFQKDIVQQVVCDQAEFDYENEDAIDSVISSYSINGVAMKFGDGFNLMTEDGVPVQRSTYALLQQTGLCCRLAR